MKTEEMTMEKEEQGGIEEVSKTPGPLVEMLAAEKEAVKIENYMRIAVYEIENKLAKAGARSPKLLSEVAKELLQVGENGEVENVAAVVDHLKRQFPEQFGSDLPAESIDGGAVRITSPAITKEALLRMTPTEIQRLDWTEVRSVLAER